MLSNSTTAFYVEGRKRDLEPTFESLRKSERTALLLRNVYERYGYRSFRMGKFEEYDFYNENRDFLPPGPIMTFTDMNGKLMALKPDVTLSIVKNSRAAANAPERLYYTENIYRMSREVRELREIYQVGVEYIGAVAPFTNVEIIGLACRSLACIEESYVLNISHMGYLTGLFQSLALPAEEKRALLACIKSKNAHELCRLSRQYGLPSENEERLLRLLRISGPLMESLGEARALCVNDAMLAAVEELGQLAQVLNEAPLKLDFSIASDPQYYNGLMFRGFVQSVPRAVLSGGRYDPLVRRMGKENLEAIGFALYFDEIDRYFRQPSSLRYDAFILYDEESSLSALFQASERLAAQEKRVGTGTVLPVNAETAALYRLCGDVLKEERSC
ncbi:MAG: hypothetical protein EOM66_04805 [Clostridia bacterium]|nr:hypothetical protein [Clostridia bacterium]